MDDVHARYVDQLAARRNWPALIRYWIAHGRQEPAIRTAIRVVREDLGTAGMSLARWLDEVAVDPMKPRDPPQLDDLDLTEAAQAAIFLATMFSRFVLCEGAGQFPVEHQDRLFGLGMQTSTQFEAIGLHFDDPALVACSAVMLARAQQEIRDLEQAAASYQEALAAYRRLAEARPDVYLPDVAGTLNNLGNVQLKLHQFEQAAASYQEAEVLYEPFERSASPVRLMERFGLYCNYANLVLRDDPRNGWPDRAKARELLAKASRIAEQIRGTFGDPRERIRIQQQTLGMFFQRVQLCLEIGWLLTDPTGFHEALEAAEASRSRALLDSLAEQLVPDEAPLELKNEFQRLGTELRRAQRRMHLEFETLEALQRHIRQNDASQDSPPDSEPGRPRKTNRAWLPPPQPSGGCAICRNCRKSCPPCRTGNPGSPDWRPTSAREREPIKTFATNSRPSIRPSARMPRPIRSAGPIEVRCFTPTSERCTCI